MEYKKIDTKKYTLHLINNDRFKSMNLVIFFTKKFDKKDLAYGSMLVKNLVYTSKLYNTKNKISKKGEDLYGAKVSASFGLTGSMEEFIVSLDFLNPIYTDKKYFELSLDFLCEVLFNPNVMDNAFQKDYFNLIKREVINNIKSIKDNPNQYANVEFSKLMYKGSPTSYAGIPSISDVEQVTESDLYSFYKKLFDGSYKTDIILYGEFDDSVIDVINKKFQKLNSSNKIFDIVINQKYDSKVVTKVDSLPFNQSKLYLGYRLNNLNYHEINHVLKLYNTILGTMNDSVLFKIVREENSLCYSVGSYYSKFNPSLIIYAGINKENYEKTVLLIKDCVNQMKNKKTLERLFDSAKKTINTYLNTYYDDVSSQVNKYYYRQYIEDEDIEDLRCNINKVTIDEIIKLNDKISLSTIYFMKGDN